MRQFESLNNKTRDIDEQLFSLWPFIILAVMELSIWKVSGLNPKDVVTNSRPYVVEASGSWRKAASSSGTAA